MIKKLLVFVMIFTCLICIAGCSTNKYNAVLYDTANEWIDDNYLKENRVKAYYINDNYVEGESDISDKYVYDEAAPLSRTLIIHEQSEFGKIFSEFDSEIDFDNKIVILYIFADVYPNRRYYLKNLQLDDKNLNIYFNPERKNVDDATAPYQRSFMVVLDKIEVAEVNFIKQN